VFVRIVPRGGKRFLAFCEGRVQALLLLWNERRCLSLPIGLLPKVGAGQERPSSAEQD